MTEIRDCFGRLVCKADKSSGLVVVAYKGHKTKTVLQLGEDLEIKRQNSLARLTRINLNDFLVESKPLRA